MRRAIGVGMLPLLALLPAGVAFAEDSHRLEWSGTFEARMNDFRSPVEDDGRTGFFDQYEYTRNKNDDPAVEFGVSDLELDLIDVGEDGEETPQLQFRFRSPTSNVGVGDGFEFGEMFLNQRADLQARLPGLALDLDYRRLRTEELRVFNASGFSPDLTAPDDRFFVRRTGIAGDLRIRPAALLGRERSGLFETLSEISLRGGYQERKGQRQQRTSFLASDTNDLQQELNRGGAGIVLNPMGLFTLALDFDHQRFREDVEEAIGFIPDTKRTTGTARFNATLGERAVLHGGFLIASLNQEGNRTPAEIAAGIRGNKVQTLSANLAADVALTDASSLNAFVRFDNRRNQLEEAAFVIDGPPKAFLDRVRRVETGAELVYRLARGNRVSVGVRGNWTNREIDFATPPPSNIGEDTRTFAAYLSTRLRPARGLQLSGEIGYRNAPDTAYVRELDDVTYGRVRASYVLPFERPVVLSLFGRGEFGENHDFRLGAEDQDFDRDRYSYGATVSGSPRDGLSLFGSVFHHDDDQDFDLDTLTPSPALEAPLDYRADATTFVFGGSLELSERTDARLSYSFTRSNWRFQSDGSTAATIDNLSRIRSDIHGVEAEIGRWLRSGLRLSAGYRFQNYRDRTAAPTNASGVEAFNPSTRQHTVLLGVTLTSDILKKTD